MIVTRVGKVALQRDCPSAQLDAQFAVNIQGPLSGQVVIAGRPLPGERLDNGDDFSYSFSKTVLIVSLNHLSSSVTVSTAVGTPSALSFIMALTNILRDNL